jgi:flagellar hook protein FlgE
MSFQQGLSGLNASSKNLDVIGNNIANANTYGAKSSRGEFADMYAARAQRHAGANAGRHRRDAGGCGPAVHPGQHHSTTDNPLDLAINGAGFFHGQTEAEANPMPLYTRNGQFKVDREGFIVNNDGAKLLGYPADGQRRDPARHAHHAAAAHRPASRPSRPPRSTAEINLDSRKASRCRRHGAAFDMATDPTTYNTPPR